MLKLNKSTKPLQLQSYKIDSSQLQTKINQLEQLKSQLQSTLSMHKQEQGSIIEQLQSFKLENQRLRSDIAKLQFTKKSQAVLIQQLQQRLQQSQNLLYSSQNQLQSQVRKRQQIISQYQKKLELFLHTKSNEIQYQGQRMKTSQVIEVEDPHEYNQLLRRLSDTGSQNSQPKIQNQPKRIKRIKKFSAQSGGLPRNSIQLKDKYKIDNTIIERQQDSNLTAEDVYLQMIRYLYKQLVKIEIKSKDIIKIPIIDSFSKLRSPTKNDVNRLLANYPFQIRETHKNDIVYSFIIKELERKGHMLSGREIIKEIADSLQGIEGERQISLASANSSARFSDSDLRSSLMGSNTLRRVSKPQVVTAFQYYQGTSKATIEDKQSVRSNESL